MTVFRDPLLYSLVLGVTLATACSTGSTKHASSTPVAAESGDARIAASGVVDAGTKTDAGVGPAADGVIANVPATGGGGAGANGGEPGGGDDVIVEDGASVSASDCYKGARDICDVEVAISKTVNQERVKAGLHTVTFSAKASWVARQWSTQQGSAGQISHAGWPSAREAAYSKEFGPSAKLGTNAENVAMTSGGAESGVAREFMDMWMHSPGHRANILGPSAAIGIGVAKSASGEWYATQIFTFGSL
jgi:uncharacterized protein YkwD